MQVLVKFFWRMCLMQKAPQDLPASPTLLGLLLILHVTLGVLLELLGQSLSDAILSSIASTAVMSVLTYLLLTMFDKRARLVQTLSAMAGTDLIFGGIALVAMLLFYQGLDIIDLAIMVQLLLLIWSIAVGGHILRHALSVSYGLGLLISFMFLVTTYTFLSFFFAPVS